MNLNEEIDFLKCDKCGGDRILEVSGKCSDMCFANFQGREHDGYVPSGFGVGGGDYVEVDLCLDCGKAQGQFPKEGNPLED